MSTQYDGIKATYEEMRKLPYSILQDANVEAAVELLIQGARDRDLACEPAITAYSSSNGAGSGWLDQHLQGQEQYCGSDIKLQIG